jgi:hypothetical protein
MIADVSLPSLTTSHARHFLGSLVGLDAPFDWGIRAITALGHPPPDIWKRIHHAALTPRLSETFYKFILNVLPLGWRISRFAPEHSFCHFCPELPQTLQHFVFSCPLARVVWQELQFLFHLSSPVTLQQAAFSWSRHEVVSGHPFGFQLQAGHAIALHALWKLYTAARYGNRPASATGARAILRADLLMYLTIQFASTGTSSPQRAIFLERWSHILSFSSQGSSFTLLY